MTLAGVFIGKPRHMVAATLERIAMFQKNQMSIAGIVMLMQELLEMDAIDELPRSFAVAAQHCVAHGYCTVNGRALQ